LQPEEIDLLIFNQDSQQLFYSRQFRKRDLKILQVWALLETVSYCRERGLSYCLIGQTQRFERLPAANTGEDGRKVFVCHLTAAYVNFFNEFSPDKKKEAFN
jgi:hypothetical protein